MARFFAAAFFAGGVATTATPPTLAVVDNGDGTGATATISGGDSGVTNDVYYMALDATEWTLGGSRTGNETVAIDLAPGVYWFMARASDAVDSNLVYLAVTSGVDPLHYRILHAVQAVIRQLLLPGIDADNIEVVKVPAPKLLRQPGKLPAILITPRSVSANPQSGTTGTDDVVYVIQIALLRADDQEPTLAANLSPHLQWHEAIARSFHNRRLAGVAEVHTGVVSDQEPVWPGGWSNNLLVGSLVARFTARVSRNA